MFTNSDEQPHLTTNIYETQKKIEKFKIRFTSQNGVVFF